MKIVRDILNEKGTTIWSVTPETTIFDALKLMADKNIGAVLVMEGHEILGIMSERDYARKVILTGKSSKNTPVRDIMTSRVVYVDVSKNAEECLALMNKEGVRHLPVFESDKLVGLISMRDVVKAVIEDKQIAIDELENYITGRR